MTTTADGQSLSDDDIQSLLDENPDQDTPLVRRLRRQLADVSKAKTKETDDLTGQLTKANRELLAYKAGLPDLGGKKLDALLAVHDGEETPEAIRRTAIELGMVTPTDADTQAQTVDDDTRANVETQGRISTAVSGATSANTGVISPADVASWPHDKQREFLMKYRDEAEKIKRGQEVAAPAGFLP